MEFSEQVNWSIKIEHKFWPSSQASEKSLEPQQKHESTIVLL